MNVFACIAASQLKAAILAWAFRAPGGAPADSTKALSKDVTLSAWDTVGGATANPGGGTLTTQSLYANSTQLSGTGTITSA